MAIRLGVDTRVTRQMLQIGVMCSRLQRFDDAERIIRGVMAFRTDIPHPGTALAGALGAQSRWLDAERELDGVLSMFPNHQLGKALLGLTYRQTERDGWQRLLQEVIDDGRDEWSVKFAHELLGFAYTPAPTREDRSDRQDLVVPPSPSMYA